jgi:hypothetical protein
MPASANETERQSRPLTILLIGRYCKCSSGRFSDCGHRAAYARTPNANRNSASLRAARQVLLRISTSGKRNAG